MKNKVLKYILLGLLISLGAYILISFILNKDGTMYWINKIIDWANKPLPIVGVSFIALFIFFWKVIKYIRETKPNEDLKAIREEHEEYKKDSEKDKAELRQENSKLKGYIVHICELSANEKIKTYGKELLSYGEETTNHETKAE